MLPLSQRHLSHLESCARRYEYVFFDSLAGPASYEQHVKTQWGSQFHRLMQQQALHLPVETLAGVDEEMSASLLALQAAAPDVFTYLSETLPSHQASDQPSDHAGESTSAFAFSQSEHRRTLAFNGYLLTAIYDLVVLSQAAPQKQGLIFDWKTHQQPPNKDQLQRDWQTRLYLYLLSETSELAPEEISMTYWFVRTSRSDGPSFYKFSYSLAEHDQTRRDLQELTIRLTQMRKAAHFPKVAIEKGLCDRCPFNVRCDRPPANQRSPDKRSPDKRSPLTSTSDPQQLLETARQLAIEDIPEIPL